VKFVLSEGFVTKQYPKEVVKEICIVAPANMPWVASFIRFVDNKFRISVYSPEEFSGQVDSDSSLMGLILHSEQQSDTFDVEWIRNVRTMYSSEVPLVVVTPSSRLITHASLLAAGVAVVCDEAASPHMILKELLDRNSFLPAVEELHSELLSSFLQATQNTLEDFIKVKAEIRMLYRNDAYQIFGDYSVSMSVSTNVKGVFVLSFPRATDLELGRIVLTSINAEISEELIQACLAEFINIVTGKAKGILARTDNSFAMGIPAIASGVNHEIFNKSGLVCFGATFTSDIGDFYMQICMNS
jgi:chemotaxis protein CheX